MGEWAWKRFRIWLNCVTQLLAATLCISLNANESTSGASYRNRHKNKVWWWVYKTINAIFFWEDNHCLRTAVKEKADSQELLDAYRYQ